MMGGNIAHQNGTKTWKRQELHDETAVSHHLLMDQVKFICDQYLSKTASERIENLDEKALLEAEQVRVLCMERANRLQTA